VKNRSDIQSPFKSKYELKSGCENGFNYAFLH